MKFILSLAVGLFLVSSEASAMQLKDTLASGNDEWFLAQSEEQVEESNEASCNSNNKWGSKSFLSGDHFQIIKHFPKGTRIAMQKTADNTLEYGKDTGAADEWFYYDPNT